jgi:hypothetical protein
MNDSGKSWPPILYDTCEWLPPSALNTIWGNFHNLHRNCWLCSVKDRLSCDSELWMIQRWRLSIVNFTERHNSLYLMINERESVNYRQIYLPIWFRIKIETELNPNTYRALQKGDSIKNPYVKEKPTVKYSIVWSLKGTVARDFWPLVFFMNRSHMGP